MYPPTGKDSDAKNSINSLKHNTIDSLINNLIDFEKVEVATAKEKVTNSSFKLLIIETKEDENEEPKEVMRQMNEKLERLRASVLQLQTRLRKKNKDE